MSFQKVVKQLRIYQVKRVGFRTVSFQKVVKLILYLMLQKLGFRTVSFQKVVKQKRVRNFST